MYVFIAYKDYGVVEDAVGDFCVRGRTTITILPSLKSIDQSNLSPALRPNCFTTNMGIVVLRDALVVEAKATVVVSPNHVTELNPTYRYLKLPLELPKSICIGNVIGNSRGRVYETGWVFKTRI